MFRVRFVLPLSACHVGFVPAVFRVQFVDIEISDTPLAMQLSVGMSYVVLDARFRSISGGSAIHTTHPLYLENITADSSVTALVSTGLPKLEPTRAHWQGTAYLSGTKSSHSSGTVPASRMRRASRPRPTFELPFELPLVARSQRMSSRFAPRATGWPTTQRRSSRQSQRRRSCSYRGVSFESQTRCCCAQRQSL